MYVKWSIEGTCTRVMIWSTSQPRSKKCFLHHNIHTCRYHQDEYQFASRWRGCPTKTLKSQYFAIGMEFNEQKS